MFLTADDTNTKVLYTEKNQEKKNRKEKTQQELEELGSTVENVYILY